MTVNDSQTISTRVGHWISGNTGRNEGCKKMAEDFFKRLFFQTSFSSNNWMWKIFRCNNSLTHTGKTTMRFQPLLGWCNAQLSALLFHNTHILGLPPQSPPLFSFPRSSYAVFFFYFFCWLFLSLSNTAFAINHSVVFLVLFFSIFPSSTVGNTIDL